MGDVALVLPALVKVLEQHPDLKITLVTRKKFGVFFKGYPAIKVFEADFDDKHKGFTGLVRLFRELKQLGPQHIADLHQNLRTTVLKAFFALSGIGSHTLDKGREEKKALTRKDDKIRRTLPHATERYLDVFRNAGIPSSSDLTGNFFNHSIYSQEKVQEWLNEQGIAGSRLIGIAPFAQHEAKIWPLENYRQLILRLAEKYPSHRLLLFGGGQKEKELLNDLSGDKVFNVVGLFGLEDELTLISRLQLMICGDSSNMHLAALSDIPVLSIWGATHTDAGFGPLANGPESILEIPVSQLGCRPCSVYGNKPCFRGDYACLNWITPDMAAEKTAQFLH